MPPTSVSPTNIIAEVGASGTGVAMPTICHELVTVVPPLNVVDESHESV
ncbi:MAG: hypothetical protein ACYCXT_13055 [Acidiferrobacteraceae bacterium]